MAKPSEKRGLGRGLSALMADIDTTSAAARPLNDATQSAEQRAISTYPIDLISPNPDQPRRNFPEDALNELAESIREKGILQPLILRPDPTDPARYQIVAGERRWRAAQKAQLHNVPALVRDFTETEVLEVAIIENIQRADLNPLEEAEGYRQLIDRFGHTQEQLAKAMGKSRSHLANSMRLLNLPSAILDLVADGALSAGHARALLTADDPIALARRAVDEGLSVRAVEKLAKAADTPPSDKKVRKSAKSEKDADTRSLESELSAALKMNVVIDHDVQNGSGKITLKYKDLEQLDDLMQLLHTPG